MYVVIEQSTVDCWQFHGLRSITNNMHWTRITAALVIISLLFGCASFSPIGIQTSPDGDIQLSQPILPGDRVRLVMKSGETSEFRAVVVEQNRVSSESTTYELKDVESIEVFRAQDGGRGGSIPQSRSLRVRRLVS